MRILIVFLMLSTMSWAQNTASRDLMADKAPCVFEMTVEELTAYELYFTCDKTKTMRPFGIENFKIKFSGQRTIKVTGNMLDANARASAAKAKVGDQIFIFEIEHIVSSNNTLPHYKALVIKLIE